MLVTLWKVGRRKFPARRVGRVGRPVTALIDPTEQRPEGEPMSETSRMPRLRAIVKAYRDEHGATESWVADRIGLDRGGLWAWWNRGLKQIPSPGVLYRLSVVTRTPYRDVLDAALHDFGYLPESDAMTLGSVQVTIAEVRISEGGGESVTPAPSPD